LVCTNCATPSAEAPTVNTLPFDQDCAATHANVSYASSPSLRHKEKLPSDLHVPRMSWPMATKSPSAA